MSKSNVVSLIPGIKPEHQENWDAWHVPARDDKGHYVNLQVKVPPAFKGQAASIIESKKYPYRSIGYLYRHAFMLLMNYLRQHPLGDGVGSTVHTLNAMIEIVREDEYMEDFRTIFDRLDARVKEHKSRGNQDRARQLVMKVWAQIKQMNDDFWRDEYEAELNKRYGELLKQK
jgi:hypothetical protein